MKLTIILVTVLAVNANFPVQDTEDVRAAKAIFYKAFDAAKAGEHAALVSDVNASVPGYIEDAEDVKAAKAEFFKAFAAAEAGDNYLADTPEVAEAKKAFFAFYEKRKLCLSRIANGERRKRSIYCVYGGGSYPSNDYIEWRDPNFPYPPTMVVRIRGSARDQFYSMEGDYVLVTDDLVNGVPYYYNIAGSHAIWYDKVWKSWNLGPSSKIGLSDVDLSTDENSVGPPNYKVAHPPNSMWWGFVSGSGNWTQSYDVCVSSSVVACDGQFGK